MFKLKSMPKVKFDNLLQMKEALGLDERDTVFGYCKRTGDTIYILDLVKDILTEELYFHTGEHSMTSRKWLVYRRLLWE